MLIRAAVLSAAVLGAAAGVASAAPGQGPSPAPLVTPSMAAEDPAITAQVKAQYAAWAAGKPDLNLYTAEFKSKVTPETVKQLSTVLQGLGDPTKLWFLNRSVIKDNSVYTYEAATPKGNVRILFALDAAQKISGLYFAPAP
jgi:hypothetical protein